MSWSLIILEEIRCQRPSTLQVFIPIFTPLNRVLSLAINLVHSTSPLPTISMGCPDDGLSLVEAETPAFKLTLRRQLHETSPRASTLRLRHDA